jgi:quercetin dioxygenase-like cupin family protein
MSRTIIPKNVEGWAIEKHVGVYARLLVEGQNMTVLWTRWEPGASAPEHIHPHEQVAVCLEGEFIFTVGGEECVVSAGEFIHIPSNTPHAERNEQPVAAVLADFFSPVRRDLHEQRFLAKILNESGKG